jgi:hypothetical protein
MAWKKSNTTKHTCNMVFGRKTAGCPRCDELLAGAAPVKWDWAERKKAQEDRAMRYPPRPHACTPSCGSVCTFGEW